MKNNSLKQNIIKYFLFIILLLSAHITLVNARQMTLKELGDELDALEYDVESAFIIGNYVFTNHYSSSTNNGIDTSDIMLASRSIQLSDFDEKNPSASLTKMSIFQIERKVNDETLEFEGWETSDNYVGKEKLELDDNKTIDIKYIDYKYYAEISKAEIKFDENTLKKNEYKSGLTTTFGFNGQTKLYGDKDDEKLTYNEETGKLTGLMFHYEITKGGFTGADKTGYYLPFVIEVPNATNETVVTINEDKETKVLGKDFDVKPSAVMATASEGQTPGVLVVWSIPGENENDKITITVDLDGDKTEYGETTYTIDYSGLEFQGESKAKEINLTGASDKDKNTLKNEWGYDSTKNKDENGETGQPKLEKEENNPFTYKLKGTLVEQKINDSVYGAAQADGYYFDFTILLENNTDKKALVKAKVGTTGQEKTFQESEFDDSGNLTILQRIAKDSSCVTNKSNEECKITITIDLDGNKNKYFPRTYTIDYSGVTFEKSSIVEVSDLDTISGDLEGNWNGWEPGDDYETHSTVDPLNPDLIKVSGFIPIFDDEWDNSNNPFTTAANDYYLGFKIKKAESSGSTSQTVVFLHDKDEVLEEGNGENNKITQADFGENSEIYVLKYINPFKVGSSKKFTITIDFDDDGKTYAPYTITIDWSDLKFQKESGMTEVKVIDSKDDESDLTETDRTTLEETYGYKAENAGDINVTNGSVSVAYNLEGKVKEQTINEAAGFNSTTGYYVVLKIEGPSKEEYPELSNKWTVQFKNESGEWKNPVKPTEEDYQNGFIVALIKLKDQDDKTFKYKIDFDGDEKNYIPYEETIDYSKLTFLPAEEVKINGVTEDNVSIYIGEPIPTEILNKLKEEQNESIEEELKPYRQLAYFTSSDGTKIDNNISVTEDMIYEGALNLTSHWNLNSDKFVTDVITDLNDSSSSNSSNFDGEIELVPDESNNKNIKIKVKNKEATVDLMNTTSIPGTMAYVLLKGDVKEITLKVNEEHSKVFNNQGPATMSILNTASKPEGFDDLKKKIQDGAKELYDGLLGGVDKDKEVTLSSLASGPNSTFQLIIGSTEENVTLIDDKGNKVTNPTYTFEFDSSAAVVSSEKELKDALANIKVTEIYIKKDFELGDENADSKHTLVIDLSNAKRNITIESLKAGEPVTISDTEQTEEGEKDKTPVIEVKNGNVTFKNIKIKGATRAITVDAGANVTAINVTALGSQDTAFDVSGTFVGEDIKYMDLEGKTNKESYHYPTICGKGNISVKNVNLRKVDNYQRIVHSKTGKYTEDDFKNPETHQYYQDFIDENGALKQTYQDMIKYETVNPPDFLSQTNHTHYYLNSENGDYYKFYFRDSRTNLIVHKYFAKGDTITPPSTQYYFKMNEQTRLHFFIAAQIKNGHTYVFDGWSKNENDNNDGVNTNGTKVDSFELPDSPDKVQSYYTHFSDGYRVTIPMDVEGQQYTGIFGVVKKSDGENKISDLLSQQDGVFKETFEAQKKKAEQESKTLLDKSDHSKEISESTVISKNLDIEIGELQTDPQVSYTVGSLNETIMPSENGKFSIPVNINSTNFKNNISEVKITDPTGKETTVKYSSDTDDGIATVSNASTMKLNLEAIKAAKITGGNKIYKISVDVDGSESDEYAVANYTIDYNNTKTLEEVINEAAKNTADAINLTVSKDTSIMGVKDKFKYEYDKEKALTLITKDDNEKEYSFKVSSVLPSHVGPASIVVTKKGEGVTCTFGENSCRPNANGWVFTNFIQHKGIGVHEINLLQDVLKATIKDSVYAIDTVTKESDPHTYKVKLSHEKLVSYLNDNYISSEKYDDSEETQSSNKNDVSDTVELKVVLDATEKYLQKVETVNNFTINRTEDNENSTSYSNNYIKLEFSEIGKTTLDEPKKLLSLDDFTNFYENCKKQHKTDTGADFNDVVQ